MKKIAPHGKCVRETVCHNESKRCEWLRKGKLKKDTESFSVKAIKTNSVKYSIDETSETPRCRLCNKKV